MINASMTFLTLKETVRSLMVLRKKYSPDYLFYGRGVQYPLTGVNVIKTLKNTVIFSLVFLSYKQSKIVKHLFLAIVSNVIHTFMILLWIIFMFYKNTVL